MLDVCIISMRHSQDVALVSITLHNMWACSAIVLSAYLAAVEPFIRDLLEKGSSPSEIFLFGQVVGGGRRIDWLVEPTPKSIQRSLASGVHTVFKGTVDSKTFHGSRGGFYAR